jgi:hypothetical protein
MGGSERLEMLKTAAREPNAIKPGITEILSSFCWREVEKGRKRREKAENRSLHTGKVFFLKKIFDLHVEISRKTLKIRILQRKLKKRDWVLTRILGQHVIRVMSDLNFGQKSAILTRKSDKLILKTCKNAIGVGDANKKVTLFQVGKAKKSCFWVNIHTRQKVTFIIFRFSCVKT